MRNTLLPLFILNSLALSSFPSFANEEPEDSSPKINGIYIGVGVGSFGYSEENSWTNESGLAATTNGNTTKIYLGYQFNKIVGIEGSYTDYGKTKSKVGNYSMEPSSLSLAANLGYTFSNGIRPFGLVGMSSLDTHQNKTTLTDDSGAAFRFGVGVDYAPETLHGVQFRAAYEMDMYTVEYVSDNSYYSDNYLFAFDALYVGASYKF
ncbi:porin family protein [Aliivibrio wodanis]|uniref:porin family protein n=1 Tax=Aliivibrio wodanis TaxID=80852 RepID=UPI00406C975F